MYQIIKLCVVHTKLHPRGEYRPVTKCLLFVVCMLYVVCCMLYCQAGSWVRLIKLHICYSWHRELGCTTLYIVRRVEIDRNRYNSIEFMLLTHGNLYLLTRYIYHSLTPVMSMFHTGNSSNTREIWIITLILIVI